MEHSAVMRQIGNGRYSLVRELGRGGMGVVWLANDTMLGRDVAVKELLTPVGIPAHESAVYQERVLREARIASRLANAAVVTVHDLIRDNDQTFIVMEFVQAPTLTELIERDGPMPAARAARLAEQLLSALEAAHVAGIVHRDVKPGNVMVPAKDTAKLTDFGIAQSFEDPRLTSTGTLIGSPAYMSPERLEGGDVSPAWDLWALGATLFFAVEGHAAYQRSTTSATMLAVMTERPAPRLCRGPLAELITGLLEPDPERRIRVPRARQLIEHALGQIPAAEPPTVRTASVAIPYSHPPLPAPKRTWPRYGTVIGAATAIILVTIGIIAIVNPRSSDNLGAGNPTTTAHETQQSTSPPSIQSTLQSTSQSASAKAVTSKAMVPVMSYGPGGDIVDLDGPMIDGDCLNWTPKKGGKAPDIDADTGCYGPHEVEVLQQDWANRELEKDVAYPSLETLAAQTGTACTKLFLSGLVTPANKEQALRYWVIVPNAEAWKVKTTGGYRMSNRLTYCFVGKADGTKLSEPVMADS
jgi:eukaryotic-like serine/threonine-protein kinase